MLEDEHVSSARVADHDLGREGGGRRRRSGRRRFGHDRLVEEPSEELRRARARPVTRALVLRRGLVGGHAIDLHGDHVAGTLEGLVLEIIAERGAKDKGKYAL